MTFGQMKQLTDRFEEIKNGSPEFKEERFESLRTDLLTSFNFEENRPAYELYKAVGEELPA